MTTTMNELLDQQDKEIDLLSEAISQLQEKLDPILLSESPQKSEPMVKDSPGAGYQIGDHLARNNDRINDLQEKLASIKERLPL